MFKKKLCKTYIIIYTAVYIFVNIIMLLQLGAVGNYLMTGKYALSVYWLACLTINFVVTYSLGKQMDDKNKNWREEINTLNCAKIYLQANKAH